MRSKYGSRLLVAAIAALASLALAAPVVQAATPAKGYERFAGCPSPKEVSTVEACLYSVIKSGHFKIGSKNVPISKPITLSGGVNGSLGQFVANSKGGLSAAKQLVPGGVIGLTGLDWLVNWYDFFMGGFFYGEEHWTCIAAEAAYPAASRSVLVARNHASAPG